MRNQALPPNSPCNGANVYTAIGRDDEACEAASFMQTSAQPTCSGLSQTLRPGNAHLPLSGHHSRNRYRCRGSSTINQQLPHLTSPRLALPYLTLPYLAACTYYRLHLLSHVFFRQRNAKSTRWGLVRPIPNHTRLQPLQSPRGLQV